MKSLPCLEVARSCNTYLRRLHAQCTFMHIYWVCQAGISSGDTLHTKITMTINSRIRKESSKKHDDINMADIEKSRQPWFNNEANYVAAVSIINLRKIYLISIARGRGGVVNYLSLSRKSLYTKDCFWGVAPVNMKPQPPP